MSRPWMPIAELDAVPAELVSLAGVVLGPDLVGAYLQGSFALGGAGLADKLPRRVAWLWGSADHLDLVLCSG